MFKPAVHAILKLANTTHKTAKFSCVYQHVPGNNFKKMGAVWGENSDHCALESRNAPGINNTYHLYHCKYRQSRYIISKLEDLKSSRRKATYYDLP